MSSSRETASLKRDSITPVNASMNKSCSSRDWSRDSSARRNQELKRLNQIERRRQLLELKQQNDLFEQMSLAASDKEKSNHLKRIASIEVTLKGSSPTMNDSDVSPFEIDDYSTSTQANALTAQAISSKSHDSEDQQSTGEIKKAYVQQSTSSIDLALKTSRLTSRSGLLENSLVDNHSDDLDYDYQSGGGKAGSGGKTNGEAWQEDKIVETKHTKASSPSKSNKSRNRNHNSSVLQQSNSNNNFTDKSKSTTSKPSTKRPMSLESLEEFVSARIPENKRVLCLIVRDKLSRLNKTKSYFYPSYYLFIQAIVDIDDKSSSVLANRDRSDDDLHGVTDASTSVDNSFSASSSISADMLFIGANSSVAGVSSSSPMFVYDSEAVNMSQSRKPTSNSYSDNEVYADTETEDDYQKIDMNRIEKQAQTVNGQIGNVMKFENLQGRNSPLVFPNHINSNSDIRESACVTATNRSAMKSLTTTKEQAPSHKLDCKLNEINTLSSSNAKKTDSDAIKNATAKVQLDGTGTESTRDHKLRMAAEASFAEDSNEDGDDLDDSDIDELANNSRQRDFTSSQTNTKRCADYNNNNEEVDYTNTHHTLFDNEINPYTGTYGVLLAGRRRRKTKTYLIGPNEHGYTRKNSICKLKSNVLGTQFNAIRLKQPQNNDRCTIASISYETNVLGFKGPRKMRVFLAKESTNECFKSLPETFKKNPDAVVQLKNMTPSWNVESQSYVLNFHGRVTQASVKNFQLIECDDYCANEGQKYDSKQLSSGEGGQIVNNKTHLTTNKDYHWSDEIKHLQQSKNHQQETFSNSDEHNKQHTKLMGDGKKDRSMEKDENNNSKECAVNSSKPSDYNNKGNGCSENLESDKSPQQATTHKGYTYNNSIVMQFGRISSHEFTCDVAYPLSILQAFAIALSSFDSKLACE